MNHNLINGLLIFALGVNLASGQSAPVHTHGHSAPKHVLLAMMDTMMVSMDRISTHQAIRVTFLQLMIPHHQGAIAMANYEVQHGHDFGMVQLAKSILTEQTHEVQQMKAWLSQPLADTTSSPVSFRQDMTQSMNRMMQAMPDPTKLTDTDRAFARIMKSHHQAAIDMAKALLKFTMDQPLRSYATRLITEQQIDIDQMTHFLN